MEQRLKILFHNLPDVCAMCRLSLCAMCCLSLCVCVCVARLVVLSSDRSGYRCRATDRSAVAVASGLILMEAHGCVKYSGLIRERVRRPWQPPRAARLVNRLFT